MAHLITPLDNVFIKSGLFYICAAGHEDIAKMHSTAQQYYMVLVCKQHDHKNLDLQYIKSCIVSFLTFRIFHYR